MTIYARSDVASVHVPAEDFGGCATTHSRPVVNGAPVQVWALDCPPCEDHLRHSDQWGVTSSEIPETWDESKAREDFERRGAKDKDAVLTLALARLAGIDSAELPESLTRMISGVPLHVPVQGKTVCPAGHDNSAGMKFCGECGAPMSGPAPKAALSAPQRPAAPPAAASSPPQAPRPQRLRDARLETLQALARQRDLDGSGTRPELIARLAGAGVTSADLQRMTVAA